MEKFYKDLIGFKKHTLNNYSVDKFKCLELYINGYLNSESFISKTNSFFEKFSAFKNFVKNYYNIDSEESCLTIIEEKTKTEEMGIQKFYELLEEFIKKGEINSSNTESMYDLFIKDYMSYLKEDTKNFIVNSSWYGKKKQYYNKLLKHTFHMQLVENVTETTRISHQMKKTSLLNKTLVKGEKMDDMIDLFFPVCKSKDEKNIYSCFKEYVEFINKKTLEIDGYDEEDGYYYNQITVE